MRKRKPICTANPKRKPNPPRGSWTKLVMARKRGLGAAQAHPGPEPGLDPDPDSKRGGVAEGGAVGGTEGISGE